MPSKRKDSKGRALHIDEYQRSDGRYEYRYIDPEGKRISVYSWRLLETDATPEGRKECVSLRKMEKRINLEQQEWTRWNDGITVNDCWNRYERMRLDLKQSTLATRAYMYHSHIENGIGKRKIASITYSDMKLYVNELIFTKRLSPGYVGSITTMLRQLFQTAVRDGLLMKNPCDGMLSEIGKIKRKMPQKRRVALTMQQQEAFTDFIMNTRLRPGIRSMYICLLGTGCRIGELLALTWGDVDWEHRRISINHTLTYSKSENGSFARRITTPKTPSSVRWIPMTNSVESALLEEYELAMKNGFNQLTVDGFTNFIWVNSRGQLRNDTEMLDATKRLVKRYNMLEEKQALEEHRPPVFLPIFSPHNLRHTFCTRLCEVESDMKFIQQVMGHSNITTTVMVYDEIQNEREEKGAMRMRENLK